MTSRIESGRVTISNRTMIRLLVCPLLALLMFSFPDRAEAGIWSNIKNGYHTITELPEEVDKLKESYQASMDKLEETQTMAENLRKQNELLMAENSRQSEQLAEALNSLQQAEQQKAGRVRKVRVSLYTAGALLVGYFCATRILRLVLRRKSIDNLH